MLSCKDLTVQLGKNKQTILHSASASFEPGCMHAIIGPSGCGKTTLVKAMVGILPSTGTVYFNGEEIDSPEELVGYVGFAPQFSIAHERLTVLESIQFTLQLRVKGAEERVKRLEHLLGIIGLSEHRNKKVSSLSGGQLRRLCLGLELTNDPSCMICDEVTSGLDPKSEDHILNVLTELKNQEAKTFLCIIHNLAKLKQFDSITVVHEGRVVFQGSYLNLIEYFGIEDPLHLYDVLNEANNEYWVERWGRCRGTIDEQNERVGNREIREPNMPGSCSQFVTLLNRRLLLFLRDKGYLGLTLAITFGFPLLVVIFAMKGLPDIERVAIDANENILVSLQENIRYREEAYRIASLVTGLIMFQVILLSLMGANNGGREIAEERVLFEKERLGGLSPYAYATAKIFFTCLIASFQGLWMALFVKWVCGFPGSIVSQSGILALACVSMTVVCLGFSATLASAEKASTLSIYLVGFQLPLSGVVLALPDYLTWICRPFINAFWGWSGYLKTMQNTYFYDAYTMNVQRSSPNPEWLPDPSWLPSPNVASLVLIIQLLLGAMMVYHGCLKKHAI